MYLLEIRSYCCIIILYIVMYAPSINIGVDIAMVVSREGAWRKLKHSNCDLINSPLPWYPEQSDYVVCSIKQGEGFRVCSMLYVSI